MVHTVSIHLYVELTEKVKAKNKNKYFYQRLFNLSVAFFNEYN